MENIEIESFFCPKCNRILKPSTIGGVLEVTEFPYKISKKIKLHDILICRYCNVLVKVSVLRNQKEPKTFLKKFTKIPEKSEISEEDSEIIRLREEHKENMEKNKHYPVPKRCPRCRSSDLVADSSDYGWICMSCEDGFKWQSYSVHFFGDVEVDAESPDDAIERAYDLLGDNCKVDIEAEIDKIRMR